MKPIKTLVAVFVFVCSINSQAQQTQVAMTKEAIVVKFLNGFNNPSQIGESFALLTDDYHFSDPLVQANSKNEFIKIAKELGNFLTGVEIKKIAASGNWVSVNYVFTSSIKGLETSLANEWFRVENGKIQESHLLFDATPWVKAFEHMKK